MVDSLSILRAFCLLVFGVALAALFHGLFSAHASGWFFTPLILGIVIFGAMALPQEMQFYGWLTALAILLGMLLWMAGWSASVSAPDLASAESICVDRAALKNWQFKGVRQKSASMYSCKFNQ
jgi:hypothetical protein